MARGYKLIFFRPFVPGTFAVSLGQLIAILSTASLLTASLILTNETRIWGIDPNGINAEIAGWVALALFIIVLKRRDHYLDTSELLAAAAVAYTWTSVLAVLIFKLFPTPTDPAQAMASRTIYLLWGLWIVFLIWPYAATFWAGRQLSQFGFRRFGMRAVAALLLVLALVPRQSIFSRDSPDILSQINVWPHVRTWSYYAFYHPSADDDEDNKKPLDFEAILDRQPQLIDEQLGKIRAAEGEQPEIYFVGVASYAEQDVFIREIEATKQLFDDRFSTFGRSLVLNNHRDTVETHPLASGTNLRKVLAGIGAKMNRERDILVLFMTSHGSPGTFSVSFDNAPLNNLDPKGLAQMLDDAGIKNRVLIISACYSGSFIDALKTESTMIMTAARKDRASFGCSNERHWTYFGDALINHALRNTYDFRKAYQKAKTLIEEWEKRDGLTPASEPQVFIGSGIEPRLEALTQHLARRSAEISPLTR